jgi:hypothetical protein
MEKSFPFNAILVDGQPDRTYSAEDFAAERAAYVSCGVTSADSLTVTAGKAGGMTVDVSAGMAVIDGYTYRNTDSLSLSVSAADKNYPRVDLAVLRLDLDAREMRCLLRVGTPAPSPVAPTLTVTEAVHEIPLSEIFVAANETVIEADALTDMRPRASYILNTMDVEEVLQQYKRAITDHFDTEDAAAIARAAAFLRTDGGARQVLCGDGVYRDATAITNGRVELCRFTEDGVFKPEDYPTADGRYDIVLQGGGGGGASATQTGSVIVYGGAAGGYMCLTGLTLIPDKEYAVTVGKGGEALPEGSGTGSNSVQSPGNDGGDTTFWNYTVPGGKGGPLNSQPQPVTACGFTAEVGSEGDDGRGGDSHLAHGGRSGTAGPGNYRNAQSGALGSGGGALTKYGTYIAKTGAGGDGVVIVYGIPV